MLETIDVGGDEGRQAAEDLLPLVYDELRRLARSRLAHEGAPQTLQATALVHEAWMRLVGEEDPGWRGRGHFFGAAARAMRPDRENGWGLCAGLAAPRTRARKDLNRTELDFCPADSRSRE